jgi:hypothetical protein
MNYPRRLYSHPRWIPALRRRRLVDTAATAGGPLSVTVDVAVLALTGVEPGAAGSGASSATVDVAALTLSAPPSTLPRSP